MVLRRNIFIYMGILGVFLLAIGFLVFQKYLAPLVFSDETGNGGIAAQVKINSAGFTPAILTVNQGDTVLFVNQDSVPHQPASDPYPSHSDYFDFYNPDSIKTNQSWSFVFQKVGTWSYHDQLDPSIKGQIIVKPASSPSS